MATLFVSDLHLDPSRPRITGLLLEFLRSEAMLADALYILGDLFESWVGDDEDGQMANEVVDAMRAVADSGVPVYVMRGNRDFLYGQLFADRTGAQLLPDPCVIDLYDEPTLLMHGDLLCTDDDTYQQFRRQVRDPAWQSAFQARTLVDRHAFAGQARDASRKHQAGLRDTGQLETITDVNDGAVQKTMRIYGVTRMIHGHTHRPAIHVLCCDDRPAQRIVLGDWYEQGSVLRVCRDGYDLAALA